MQRGELQQLRKDLLKSQKKISSLSIEHNNLKKMYDQLLKNQVEDDKYYKFVSSVLESELKQPRWLTKEIKKVNPKLNPAIACSILSDFHADEVVDPASVRFHNAYNRQIQLIRLSMYFENLVKILQNHCSNEHIEGLIIMMLGDMFSGIIHEELKETNEGLITESLVFWLEHFVVGFNYILTNTKEYPIHVPCISGNHGRLTQKPRYKASARDSFDWLFYKMLAKEFKDNKRITFDVSDAPEVHLSIYDTSYLLMHGHQFKGGSGISAEVAPLMIGSARSRENAQAFNEPFDILVIGHIHRLRNFGNVITNSSLKGYDEYAQERKFRYEPARQAFWLTIPNRKERGDSITNWRPIFCQDKKREQWEKYSYKNKR